MVSKLRNDIYAVDYENMFIHQTDSNIKTKEFIYDTTAKIVLNWDSLELNTSKKDDVDKIGERREK